MVQTSDFKQIHELTPADFERHPAWIGVHNYDHGQPWYEGTDDQTYRPWIERQRFTGSRGFLLLAARIELADGTVYPGFFRRVADSWDEPLPPRRMRDGNYTPAKQWSKLYGDTPLSILALQHPQIFIDGKMVGFALGKSEKRRDRVRAFYGAIGKTPAEVFPVRFSADPALADGIVEGRMDGFFSFQLRGSFEITAGEQFLEPGL
jgi:hypothetical protein